MKWSMEKYDYRDKMAVISIVKKRKKMMTAIVNKKKMFYFVCGSA